MGITWTFDGSVLRHLADRKKGEKMSDDPQDIPENERVPEPKEGGSDRNAMPVPGLAEFDDSSYVDPLEVDDENEDGSEEAEE